MSNPMKIAFLLFDGITALDFIGFYDPVTRLKTMGFINDLEWDICALKEIITDDRGLSIKADKVLNHLYNYDCIFIPGGLGTRKLQHDKEFIEWVRTGSSAKYKISVCTGSLILGSAGFLNGISATTHTKCHKELAKYCPNVVNKRIVDQGSVITAAGVSSAIDLGLYIVEKLSSKEVKEKIALQMEYVI